MTGEGRPSEQLWRDRLGDASRDVAQHFARLEPVIERDPGVFALDPGDPGRDAEIVAMETMSDCSGIASAPSTSAPSGERLRNLTSCTAPSSSMLAESSTGDLRERRLCLTLLSSMGPRIAQLGKASFNAETAS